MIDDHRQVPVVALVGNLIDTRCGKFANRSMRFSVSAQTWATTLTVRQAICINSHTACLRTRHRQPGHSVSSKALRVPGMMTPETVRGRIARAPRAQCCAVVVAAVARRPSMTAVCGLRQWRSLDWDTVGVLGGRGAG